MNFNDLRVAKKLALGFGAVVAIIVLSSGLLFYQSRSLADIERLNSSASEAISHIDLFDRDFAFIQSAVRKFVLTGQENDKDDYTAASAEHAGNVAAVRRILSQDAREFLPELDAYENAFTNYTDKVFSEEVKLASTAGTRPEAVTMVSGSASAPYSAARKQAFGKLRGDVSRWSDSWTEEGNRSMSQTMIVVATSGILSTIIALVMAWLIARAVGRPLTAMTVTMQALAAGNNAVAVPGIGLRDEMGDMARAVQVFKEAAIAKLRIEADATTAQRLTEDERGRSAKVVADGAQQQGLVVQAIGAGLKRLSSGELVYRIEQRFPPEYEQLRADFNDAMTKLQETMKVVAANASAIGSGTAEISTASDDLSRRTEQQAASLEETAAALDEITATVRKTAASAKHARDVVSSAKGNAEQSSHVVRQAVEAMSEIEKSSQQITTIIGVIDEIAFQTNLLALNAGVEAARAGDAGRGFAVVASEVRALAQRSAEAAKEIKTLISTSSDQVEHGVAFVGQTGEALDRIVVAVAELNGIVSEISSSTQEQATALEEVNTAVNQMDQVTQQNAAMVEQSTAATQALAQETTHLASLIDQFQVGERFAEPAQRRPKQAKTRAASAPVRALRVVGRGGAVAKPQAESEGWTEF